MSDPYGVHLPFGRAYNSEGEWASGAPISLTGTTAQTRLLRVLMPGGYLGPKGDMVIHAHVSNNNSANDKTFVIKAGNDRGNLTTLVTALNTTDTFDGIVLEVQNREATDSQYVVLTSVNITPSIVANPEIDTEQPFYVDVYGQLESGADTLTLETFHIHTRYRV